MSKPKWLTLRSLGIDLAFAGAILTSLVIFIYKNRPTAAEAGYNLWSPEVQRDQQMLIVYGVAVWIGYCIIFSALLKRTVGQLLNGVRYDNNVGFFKRTVSILFSPIPFVNKLLKIELQKTTSNIISKFFSVVGLLLTIASYPLFILFIFLAFFTFLAPKKNPSVENFTLCGNKYCLVKPNLACNKDLSKIKSRVVEILGSKRTGTGLIISPSLVLTNYHVVENENKLIVRQANGKNTEAILYRFDPDYDIALLIGQFYQGEHIQFVDPRNFTEGTDLYALGFPGTLLIEPGTAKSLTVTKGIYSAFIQDEKYKIDLVQTDASVNPGNSGGPLTTECGQMVGLVTLTDRIDPITNLTKEGINFAISSTTLVPKLNELLKD